MIAKEEHKSNVYTFCSCTEDSKDETKTSITEGIKKMGVTRVVQSK